MQQKTYSNGKLTRFGVAKIQILMTMLDKVNKDKVNKDKLRKDKYPKYWCQLKSLTCNSTGKINYQKLANMAAKNL